MDLNQTGHVILLNGTSCAGKTTIAQALQRIATVPYLSTGHDDFLPMFPLKYVGLDKSIQPAIHVWPEPGNPLSQQGYEVIVEEAGTPPKFHLYAGPIAWNSLRGMHECFRELARAGNNVVVADVITRPLMRDYCEVLKDYRVYVVHLDGELEILEKREREHKNRTPGGARMQYRAVQDPGIFDLRVDAGKESPQQCAERILDHVEKNEPRASKLLAEHFRGNDPLTFPIQIW